MMRHPFLPLCLAALLLTACAKSPQIPAVSADPAAATALWHSYESASAPAARPFRVQMSLRYGPEGDSRRVVALLWGNDATQLRLDVMAGVGVTVAKIAEEGKHFLLYDPSQQKAYFHQGNQKPLLVLGVPVPLGIGDLSSLLQGQYTQVFGQSYNAAYTTKNGIAYSLDHQKLRGILSLNDQGLPVQWREDGAHGWDMSIAYTDDTPPLPRRIEIQHPNGKRALILVKERDFPPKAFTPENLKLILPEATQLQPLKAATK
ncbi:MAG: lipoprotein insertase outer membrane protein LolB [Desulfovibrionaceae bacterium]